MSQQPPAEVSRIIAVSRFVAGGIIGGTLAWAYYLNIFTIDSEGHYAKDAVRNAGLRQCVDTNVHNWAGADGNVFLRMTNPGLPVGTADWVYFYGNTLLYPRRIYVTDRADQIVHGATELVGHSPHPTAEWLRAHHINAVVDVVSHPMLADDWFRVDRLTPATAPADQ